MKNKPAAAFYSCLAAALLLLAGCGGGSDKSDKSKQGGGPTQVTVAEVQLQPASYYDEYPGTTVPLSQVEIRAQVNGYVTGIFFQEGDRVRKGQKLYEIDKGKYEAVYQQAQAALVQAKANQDRAQKDADRYIYLNNRDAIAKQILDHALTDLQTAKAAVANANAVVTSARIDLNYATITAPFDGTIGLSQVKLGALVSQSQTLLNTISTENPMAVDFVVNEKEIPRFTRIEQQGASAPFPDSLFTIRLTDGSLYGSAGRLSVIDRAVDAQTGSITIRLVFPNGNSGLKAGMSCTVRVHNQDAKMQLLIPTKATIEQMGENFVYIAKDTVLPDSSGKEKKDKEAAPDGGRRLVALQRKVLLGQVIGANVIVKGGLVQGERVIVDGVQKLKDGAPITTGRPAGPAGGNGNENKSAPSGGTNH